MCLWWFLQNSAISGIKSKAVDILNTSFYVALINTYNNNRQHPQWNTYNYNAVKNIPLLSNYRRGDILKDTIIPIHYLSSFITHTEIINWMICHSSIILDWFPNSHAGKLVNAWDYKIIRNLWNMECGTGYSSAVHRYGRFVIRYAIIRYPRSSHHGHRQKIKNAGQWARNPLLVPSCCVWYFTGVVWTTSALPSVFKMHYAVCVGVTCH